MTAVGRSEPLACSESELGRRPGAVPPLHWTGIAATARNLVAARRAVQAWADAVGITAPVVEDIMLATYEAMANAAEHAYRSRPGTIDVLGACVGDEVVVEVRDHGAWRAPPADPGDRGHGLLMIYATSRAEIESGPGGTTVRMRWPRRHLLTTRPAGEPR